MRVCLIIPVATHLPLELVMGIRARCPEAEIVGVWGGADDARPAAAGWRWIDLDLPESLDIGWGRALVALPPDAYGLARAAASIENVGGDGGMLVLRVGGVVVCPGLAALSDVVDGKAAMSVAKRCVSAPSVDGLLPSRADLVRRGEYSTAIMHVAIGGPAPRAVLNELQCCADDGDVGPAFARAADSVGATQFGDDIVSVVGWNPLTTSASTAVLDVVDCRLECGHHMLFGGGSPRWPISADAHAQTLLDDGVAQADGHRLPIRCGSLEIDDALRSLMNEAIERWRTGEDAEPADPRHADQFLDWLATPWPPWGPDIGRYWTMLYRQRRDLHAAFPKLDGADGDAFRAWARRRREFEPEAPAVPPPERSLRPEWSDVDRISGGINLIGYHGFDKSLGDVVRRIGSALDAAGVPFVALEYHRSGSPRAALAPPTSNDLLYDTNLMVINADQQHNVAGDYGPVLYPGRRTIAYWFWDVDYVPDSMLPAFGFVDALLVATPFTERTLAAAGDTPVHAVPIPVPPPTRSSLGRPELGLPEGRFVFLVTFDHLSVTERKNPVGAISAFRAAFPDDSGDGPVLVVKSINGRRRAAEHDWVRQAAAGRGDVIVIDRHLDRADQMSLVAESDCLVSLHRTEGLGLHLMEAMWFEKPTIATRYSGNLSFMDDDNSALVDAVLVPVTHGEGYFPPAAHWADPDLDQAAEWMRRIAHDADLARRLGTAGRATMEAQPSLVDTGRRMMSLVQAVPIPAAGAAPPASAGHGRNLAMSLRTRVGWLAGGGSNERAALDRQTAAIGELQLTVQQLSDAVARLDRSPTIDVAALAQAIDDLDRRVASVSDVVAAMTLNTDAG